MIFQCNQCNAQYMIADEKIGKHGVKIRCKKCEHIITVRPPKDEANQERGEESERGDRIAETEPAQASGPDNKEENATQDSAESSEVSRTRDALDLNDEELGSALDNLLSFETETEVNLQEGTEEDFEQSTRVFTHEELQAVHEEREKAAQERDVMGTVQVDISQQGEHTQVDNRLEENQPLEWYAAIEDRQIGPIRLAELAQRWKQGKLDQDTLVWKSGFNDWTPMREVSELGAWFGFDGQLSHRSDGLQAESDEPEPSIMLSGVDGEYDSSEDEDDIWFQDGGHQQDLDSSEAYGQVGMEWKPSAFSNLSNLAQEELAGLKAALESDNEPLLDEGSPFGSDDDELGGLGGEEDSIVGQIAAEEQAAARRAEEERLGEERRQEEARQRKKVQEEERKLADRAAALWQQEEGQRERAVLSHESAVPTRSGLPKWFIGAILSCIAVIVALSMFIVYRLGKESSPPLSSTSQAQAPTTGLSAAGVSAKQSEKPELTPPLAAKTAHQQATLQQEQTGGKNDKKATPPKTAQIAGPSAERPKLEKKTPPDKPTEPFKRRTPASTRRRESQESRRKVVEDTSPPQSASSTDNQPTRRKPASGGILDFEDEKAFADATGQRSPAVRPAQPVPKKKELPPLSQADIMEIMRERLAEFKACTRLQKQRDASVKGKMVVTFVVERNGRVGSAVVSTRGFKGTFFGGCITRIIKQLRFPEFGGKPKTVPFPFTIK